jgi:hypothetical protein
MMSCCFEGCLRGSGGLRAVVPCGCIADLQSLGSSYCCRQGWCAGKKEKKRGIRGEGGSVSIRATALDEGPGEGPKYMGGDSGARGRRLLYDVLGVLPAQNDGRAG